MPFEIQLDQLPAGFALSASKAGEEAKVQFAGVATSEDGELLIRYLGTVTDLLSALNAQGQTVRPSQVDNLLAFIRRDKTATVYLNELQLSSKVRMARAIKDGDPVWKDDVIEIAESRLGDVPVPDDAGVVVVVSYGWRKAVLFDYGGLNDRTVRHYDVWPTLGQLVARLLFQERLSISDNDWKQLLAIRWFPFVGLSNAMIQRVLTHARASWGTSELLPDMKAELLGQVEEFLEAWTKLGQFKPHAPLLERAVERFKAEDYVSCTAIIFPRIEGILRAHRTLTAPANGAGQKELAEQAVASVADNPFSLLLPHRFQDYLREVFFANFDEQNATIPVGRNSVGHGVADPADFNLETAMLGILICHQLFYCFPPNEDASGSPGNIVGNAEH
jgi:hypothetical protein